MFKPLQLVTASACGLAVPPTLISNAPHAVRRFAAELHTTTLDPHTPWDSLLVWFLASFALGLGIEHGYTGADTTKPPTASWIVTGDGSWAEVTLAQADGQYSVVEGGPRHIWRILENTRDLWADLGQPCWERFGLTVTPDRQTVWLDRPDGDHIWSLGS